MADAEFIEADAANDFAREVQKMRLISTSTPVAVKGLHSSVLSEPDSGYEDTTADSCFSTSTTASNYSFASDSSLSHSSCIVSSDASLIYSPILKEQSFTKQPQKECHLRDWEVPEEEDIYRKINNRNYGDLPCRNLTFDLDNDSGFSPSLSADFSARFQEVLRAFSPPVLDRLIGRKMGLEEVDILSELCCRNVPCVSDILKYLQPQDLCRMCLVSRSWREAVNSDPHASNIRKTFVKVESSKKVLMGKENSSQVVNTRSSRCMTTANVFSTIQLTQRHKASTPYSKLSSSDIFSIAADSLREGEMLRHCPKCLGASRVLPVHDRGTCFNNKCNFDYCSKCFCAYHGSKLCSHLDNSKKPKNEVISTKKAKKNLKRLSAL